MRTAAIALPLVLALAGCGSNDPALTATEQQQLSDNARATIAAQGAAVDFSFSACTGREELDLFVYIPPSEQNGWVGTIQGDDVTVRAGTGDLLVTFTATGDAGPVDPYVEDLSDDASVTLTAHVTFTGVSHLGAPLSVDADFTASRTAGGGGTETFRLDGTFSLTHGNYASEFEASDFELVFDTGTHRTLSVDGSITGVIDLPNRDFDARISLVGSGTSVQLTIEAGATRIEITIDLGTQT